MYLEIEVQQLQSICLQFIQHLYVDIFVQQYYDCPSTGKEYKMMKNKIYLVTGAAGNLGGNICRQLLEKGERVRGLVLPNDPAEKYLPKEVEVIHGDLLDVPSLEEFFRTEEENEVYVIHCAAIVWEKMEMNPKVRAVNVDGTANIIEQCLKHHVRKLVYVGSTGAIPELPAGQKIREVNCFLPTEGLVGCYSVTKAEAAQLVLDAVQSHPELDATIVLPSGICGPKDYAFNSVTSMVQQFVQGKMRIGLEGTFSIADVRDLADGVIAACDKGRRGESYILTGETVTMYDMFREIGNASGLNVKSYVLSKELAQMAVKGLAAVSRVTEKDPLLSEFNIYMLNRNNEYDCSKAERELGFRCRPFSESIRDTVTWLREEGFLKTTECTEVIEISPVTMLSLLFKKLVPIH